MDSKFLKGNYKVKCGRTKKDKKKAENSTAIFEGRATEKLGGSIAFVMKSNKFIWGADEEA